MPGLSGRRLLFSGSWYGSFPPRPREPQVGEPLRLRSLPLTVSLCCFQGNTQVFCQATGLIRNRKQWEMVLKGKRSWRRAALGDPELWRHALFLQTLRAGSGQPRP